MGGGRPLSRQPRAPQILLASECALQTATTNPRPHDHLRLMMRAHSNARGPPLKSTSGARPMAPTQFARARLNLKANLFSLPAPGSRAVASGARPSRKHKLAWRPLELHLGGAPPWHATKNTLGRAHPVRPLACALRAPPFWDIGRARCAHGRPAEARAGARLTRTRTWPSQLSSGLQSALALEFPARLFEPFVYW